MRFSLRTLFVLVSLSSVVAAVVIYWPRERAEVSTAEFHWHDYSVGIVERDLYCGPPSCEYLQHCGQCPANSSSAYITIREGGYTPSTTGSWNYQVGFQLPDDISAGDTFDLIPATAGRHLEQVGEFHYLGFLKPGEFVASSFGSPHGGTMECDDPKSGGSVKIVSMTREHVNFELELRAIVPGGFNVDINREFTLPRE